MGVLTIHLVFMRKKGLCMLIIGYVGGIYVATRFGHGRRTPTQLSIDGSQTRYQTSDFVRTFVDIHRDLLDWIEETALPDDARTRVHEYRARLREELQGFQRDTANYLRMLRERGEGARIDLE